MLKMLKSLKMPLKAVLRGFSVLAALIMLAGCGGPSKPSGAPSGASGTSQGDPAAETPSISTSGLTVLSGESAMLRDGDRENAFRAFLTDGKAGEIIIDLAETWDICRVDIYPAKDGEYFGGYFPKGFELSVSAGGNDYTVVSTYKNIDAPDCVPVLEFTPVNARFVKITVTEASGIDGAAVFEIAEIEIVKTSDEISYPDVIEDTDEF